ncbi:MAG: family 20 glycosylhydrolase [Lachnospiraceae bacterium]|nr:family 20 glycosylhydrolase [Lachnospiraceae bacterium]
MYLIPTPKKMKPLKGNFVLSHRGLICLDEKEDQLQTQGALLLKKELEESLGFSYYIVKKQDKAEFIFKIQETLEEESYVVEITDQVIIYGKSGKELLYGVQTLRQIISQEGAVLKKVKIEDAPIFKNRGFYHDITRGRIPTLEWLKKLADTLSYYKINQLQLYVEHSFLFPALSEMWRDDTPLRAEEIMEFDEYCKNRGIELIPSMASFGHLYKLLRTKQYSYLSEIEGRGEDEFGLVDRMRHHTLDISNEDSFVLVKKMILEYMSLFTTKKFNLCADETFDLGKGRNKKRAQEEGVEALYMEFVKKLCNLVVMEGHIPMLWGDIMLEFPELAAELPGETICLNWNYEKYVKEDSTRIYAENKVNQYVCPGVSGWDKLINDYDTAYYNIRNMCRYGKQYKAVGVLNTDWGDFGHLNPPSHSFPAMIYGAEGSWNGDLLDKEEMNKAISTLYFRDSSGKIMKILYSLSEEYEGFNWYDLVWWKEKLANDKEGLYAKEAGNIMARGKKQKEVKEKLEQGILQIKTEMMYLDSQMRREIYSYLHGLEGMILFHKIGGYLLEREEGRIRFDNGLASKLEEWYLEYKRLWRKSSKESELYRIGEVIFWYADLLRERRN